MRGGDLGDVAAFFQAGCCRVSANTFSGESLSDGAADGAYLRVELLGSGFEGSLIR